MEIKNLYLKSLNPMVMNGFRNKKELESYWSLTKYGSWFLLISLVCFFSIEAYDYKISDYYSFAFFFLKYISLFVLILISPFLIHVVFLKLIPNKKSLPFWYVKYMWNKSHDSILVVINQLPENLISPQELKQLHDNIDENRSIEILIKIWHKSFVAEINHH